MICSNLHIYYIHFEITSESCNLIGSLQHWFQPKLHTFLLEIAPFYQPITAKNFNSLSNEKSSFAHVVWHHFMSVISSAIFFLPGFCKQEDFTSYLFKTQASNRSYVFSKMAWTKENVIKADNLCVAETYDLKLCKVCTNQLRICQILSRSVALWKHFQIVWLWLGWPWMFFNVIYF